MWKGQRGFFKLILSDLRVPYITSSLTFISWRAWRYFRLTQGQLSIFHSLCPNISFFIRRVLGALATLRLCELNL
ncbi:hypothetical protein RCIA147 [Methanocella arvoryzae MRE50]|uniref:Uncharacterized protein n=1 Tax=Methanocella arvoryzae (strain DSM 22066 / NBRC 105507 / MRE50) TaxID=351160 RepID=Q0W3D5_METAR|nr:hypothetical protein RCIA147 [Methanocella arvoryzae MRE50]